MYHYFLLNPVRQDTLLLYLAIGSILSLSLSQILQLKKTYQMHKQYYCTEKDIQNSERYY